MKKYVVVSCVGIIALLAILIVVVDRNSRYQLDASKDGAFILNTQTGELWFRLVKHSVYLGTNEKPVCQRIEAVRR